MTTSEQEVNVLYALHKEKYLCSKEGCRIEDVLLMVQRPNFAATIRAPDQMVDRVLVSSFFLA
jgi:hypothetical protein